MEHISSDKSLARLLRQLIFIPMLHHRWLDSSAKAQLSACIAKAETGHRGEIYVVIESRLPLNQAYYQNCRARALDLFALQRVWDTQENTGVLIYLNLCERSLEIIADRGIDRCAHYETWAALCKKALTDFKQGQMLSGLSTLIQDVGDVLRQHYPADDKHGNELPNHPVYLK